MKIQRPLSHAAVSRADDTFYRNHPNLVKNGVRQPLSATDPAQADLRNEWRQNYAQAGGGTSPNPGRAEHVRAIATTAKAMSEATLTKSTAGSGLSKCPLAASLTTMPAAALPPPVSPATRTCGPAALVCTISRATVKCSHSRKNVPSPANVIEVAADSVAGDVIDFSVTASSCGKPVVWTISGTTTDTGTGGTYCLRALPWLQRALDGPSLNPFSGWIPDVVPHIYRVRSDSECGAVANVYTVNAYPADKISIAVTTTGIKVYKEFKERVIDGYIASIFGDTIEVDLPQGSLSIEGKWEEDKESWQAFYKYDVIIGLDPIFGMSAKISIIDALGAVVSVPPSATYWLKKYVGDAVFIKIEGKATCDGRMTRTAPRVYANWTFGIGGKVILSTGLELKAGSEEAAKITATGEGAFSLAGRTPEEKSCKIGILVDAKFDGLMAKISAEVASGTYKFEKEYPIIGETSLWSNHEITLTSE